MRPSLSGCSGTIAEGETKYCVITNNDKPATLTVQKVLMQDNGGTEDYADFSFQVNGGTETPFDVSGTNILSVDAGTYSVTEVGDPLHGYTTKYSGCTDVALANGASATCTITNDDIAPSLTLEKTVVNVRSLTEATAWTLFAIGPSSLSGTTGVTSGTGFSAGIYNLSETGGPSFYDPSAWSCVVNGADPVEGSSVNLANGDVAVCSITNTEMQPGTLHVIKHVLNNNADGYQGSATADMFGFTVTGGNPDPGTFSGSEVGVDVTIDAGADYLVSETSGPTSQYGVSYSTDCEGTMPAGVSKTCTITNDDNPPTTGGLTVIKQVVNDNGGTKVVGDFPLTVTDESDNDTSVTSGNGQQFAPGTYTVSEVSDANYTATFSGDCDANGSVTIEAGVSKTCTIKNDDKAPSLTLVKEVTNDNGGTAEPTAWTLSATGDQDTPTILSGAGGATSDGTFQAGTYTLAESDGPTGYTAGNWSCSGDVENVDDTVTLSIGQSATCTIVNDDQQGTLHVIKHVINDNGGSATAGDFSFTINGVATTTFTEDSGDASLGTADVSLDAGTYDIAEVEVNGYGSSYEGCSQVAITNGGEATCIITNDDGQATLTIEKRAYGPDATFDFAIAQGENTELLGLTTVNGSTTQSVALDAGSYDVTETLPDGWVLNGPFCTTDGDQQTGDAIENGASITLASGDHVTCIFSNYARGGDLSIEKTIDDATPDQNQQITYTLTAHNAGPAGLYAWVDDVLPSGLEFVSADGDYSTSTGRWTIGWFDNGSTTALHIVAKVTASAGQTVVNDATIDGDDEGGYAFNDSNDESSVSFTVNTPTPTPPPSGGGGGGGGNGPIVGLLGGGGGGQVLGISTTTEDFGVACEKYLTDFLKLGKTNNPEQVRRLQYVLGTLEGLPIGTDGVYDVTTRDAVNAFQTKYANLVLTPWGITAPTGYTYLTTRKMVNEVYCHFTRNFPLTTEEQAIVDAARQRAATQGTQSSSSHSAAPSGTSAGSTGGSSSGSSMTEDTGTTQSTDTQTEDTGTQSEDNAQAGAAGTTGGGFWSNVTNFFGNLFWH